MRCIGLRWCQRFLTVTVLGKPLAGNLAHPRGISRGHSTGFPPASAHHAGPFFSAPASRPGNSVLSPLSYDIPMTFIFPFCPFVNLHQDQDRLPGFESQIFHLPAGDLAHHLASPGLIAGSSNQHDTPHSCKELTHGCAWRGPWHSVTSRQHSGPERLNSHRLPGSEGPLPHSQLGPGSRQWVLSSGTKCRGRSPGGSVHEISDSSFQPRS